MNRQPCGSPPIFESIDGVFRAETSEDPVQSVEETLHESQPSVQTASFHQQSPFHAAETTNQFSNSSEDVTVSADQERQVLLLMLLAQVCALHDPTPKTFTIHVVELYERGLLNRDSINFLFELGLVPSISPAFTNALLQVTRNSTTAPTHSEDTSSGGLPDRGSSDVSVHPAEWAASIPIDNELALTTTVTHKHNATKLAAVFAASGDPQRSAEAYAIRATLAQYEQMQRQTRSPSTDDEHETGPSVNDTAPPWDANHFPLSLSRYQREFVQIALLASGSFGQVFHATRKMDGCDYAIKKVDFGATGYSNETIQEVVREVECLAKVSDHPNVVRYYTSWLEPSWMTGGQAVELTAPPTSPSGSPTHIQRRRQSHQRLLLTNPLQDLIQPGSLSDDGAHQTTALCDPSSRTYDDSSRFFNQCGSASFESKDASSIGMWQRRRFSFGSDLDADDQNWGSYHEQSLEALERPTLDDEDESSSSIFLMRDSRNPQDLPNERRRRQSTGATASNKPVYRYQLSLYIQMQLCHPASLADWIRERNCKVPETAYEERIGPALEIFEQITMGLAHVHEKGVIHRDLKPANIFVSSDGQVIKIGDFGLSKQVQRIKHMSPTARQNAPATLMASVATTENSLKSHNENLPDTEKGLMIAGPHSTNVLTHYNKAPMFVDPLLTAGIGTRSYAAPEQLNTKTYSTAADIFSLGLIFLELVCCFETEHERLHNFQRCRQEQIVPQWLMDDYTEIATIIIACAQSDAMQRPSAKAILGMISARQMKTDVPQAFTPPEQSPTASMASSHTPIGGLHNALLRRSIERRDRELEHRMRELAEKEKEIEQLRKEMEHLKASRTPSKASSYAGDSDDADGDDTD